MGARDLGALLLLSALWGASFIFIRVAVPALGPFVLVEVRVGLAATALLLCAAALGRLQKLRVRWKQFAVLGIVNVAIPFSLISAAEINLTASLAAILNSTTVMFTAVGAAVWMGDALTAREVFGGVVGVVVLSVLGLALPSTAVAYMLYFRLISNVGPTSTSTVTLLVPLFGLLFGVVLLDEPVGLGTLAGLVLILSSVTLVTGLGAARPKPRL